MTWMSKAQRLLMISWTMFRASSANPRKQMRIDTDLFRQFPFGSPSHGWRDVDTDPSIVGFDCTKCPVATFFGKHDASQLCVQTWCALDYPLAQKWGGHLERAGTIAMGNDHCDFRWHAGLDEPGKQIKRKAEARPIHTTTTR